MEYIITVDSGTSQIKTTLYNISGQAIYKVAVANKIISLRRDWMEQDMDILWENVLYTLKETIEKSKVDPSKIKAIGLAAQGEGCWLIDENHQPLRNAILWNDSRAAEVVSRVRSNKKIDERIKSITGSYLFSGATTAILRWLKENEEENYKRAKYILYCKDWIRYKLTKIVSLEYTDLSTSPLDLRSKEVSYELLELLGIEDSHPFFSNVRDSFQEFDYIDKDIANYLGLSDTTIVSLGMLDIVSAALGGGAVTDGDIAIVLGTSNMSQIVTSDDKDFSKVAGYEKHIIHGKNLEVIGSMAGTPNLDWIIDTAFKHEKEIAKEKNINLYTHLESSVDNINAAEKGIIYHPYISNAGERAPFSNSNARAQFFGLSQDISREYLLRAVYEGVAFSIRHCLHEVEGNRRIILTGGGSQSKVWPQIISDITKREVLVPSTHELTSMGATMLAGIQAKIYLDLNDALAYTFNVDETYSPNIEKSKIYDKAYYLYTEIVESNHRLWEIRSKLSDVVENK